MPINKLMDHYMGHMRSGLCVYIYVYIQICMCIYVFIYLCIYIFIFIHVQIDPLRLVDMVFREFSASYTLWVHRFRTIP